MEYSIGSLADLITGSNTPNKKKVVKKHIPSNESTEEINTDSNETLPIPRKKKKSKIDDNSNDEEKLETKKSSTKRKNSSNDENESVPKKSKNSTNAERRVKSKEKSEKVEEDPELVARTVFVGNVPVSSDTKKLKRFFKKYGKIDSVRIRGVPVADPKTPKKVAVIKKEFHPDRKSFFAFIRFETREDAIKSTEANGVLFQDHHLRVHLCDNEERPDENKAIFVGNLSFHAEEDDLWTTFESCGSIASVRIVRDGKTGMGKGFGYVNFHNSDSVTLALEMENVKIKDRELRIKICNTNAAKKDKKTKKPKKVKKARKPKEIKSEENNDNHQTEDSKNNLNNDIKVEKGSFQGAKFVDKKKKKFNKGLLQKKKLVRQLAPK